MRSVTYDFVVIGGGIVGVATARALLARRPGANLVLLEKETVLGKHQTGHNSGVIHAGVYYAPGSLKARLCTAGERATKEFCTEHAIPFAVPGKLVVATSADEVPRMEALGERAAANGLKIERLDGAELARREPNVAGVAALFVPVTGIVDYGLVTAALAQQVKAGGDVELGVAVTGIDERAGEVTVRAGERAWTARQVVACAGLQADRVARMAGVRTDFRIVPFRGEYYRLPEHRSDIVSHLIYPVPDPDLPFLGVHLTPTIGGSVTLGPNAVLGMAREKYRKGSFSAPDVRDWATFPGMWHVARHNVRTGAAELRDSLSKRGYLARCRRYAPSLTLEDLQPQEAGIRAQAVLRDGTLVHDFLVERTARTLHVCNAPSPAATSAMPIAEMITDRLLASA